MLFTVGGLRRRPRHKSTVAHCVTQARSGNRARFAFRRLEVTASPSRQPATAPVGQRAVNDRGRAKHRGSIMGEYLDMIVARLPLAKAFAAGLVSGLLLTLVL